MRLKSWRPEELEAGIVLLTGILVGALMLFYIINGGGGQYLLSASSGGQCVIKDAATFEDRLSDTDKPLAVMFSSDTCPVCRQMEPYWLDLCRTSNEDVSYIVLKLSHSTIDLFQRYGVTETPTFIVFVNGTPNSIHVGAFPGPDVEALMREWATSSAKHVENDVFNLTVKSCSQCHTLPKSTDTEDIREWINNNPNEILASMISTAAAHNMTVSRFYQGGISELTQVILNMTQNTTSNLTQDEAYKIATLLDAMAISLSQGGSGTPVSAQEETGGGAPIGQLAGTVTAFTAGLIAAFSPCVFPILLAYTSALVTRAGKSEKTGLSGAFKAFVAASAGTLLLGIAFMVLGDAVPESSAILLPAASLVLLSAGILGYLDVPTFLNVGISTRRGLTVFSFLYGILALQCSFPLVAGALLLIAQGGIEHGAPALAAFTAGISFPVALAVYATGKEKIAGVLARMTGKKVQRYSHLFLAVMGLILLLYALGTI
ncbi:MAG: thioredoxin domain-containing protein [Desulfurococcales archaeon]|nr:thioredoxin domain-containing protein [Desulfurococcales archaeon]